MTNVIQYDKALREKEQKLRAEELERVKDNAPCLVCAKCGNGSFTMYRNEAPNCLECDAVLDQFVLVDTSTPSIVDMRLERMKDAKQNAFEVQMDLMRSLSLTITGAQANWISGIDLMLRQIIYEKGTRGLNYAKIAGAPVSKAFVSELENSMYGANVWPKMRIDDSKCVAPITYTTAGLSMIDATQMKPAFESALELS